MLTDFSNNVLKVFEVAQFIINMLKLSMASKKLFRSRILLDPYSVLRIAYAAAASGLAISM